VIGDILLIVPINIVVFVRNLFPGRWSYKCFSWRYVKGAARWVWMGENTVPSIFLRPVVISLLHWHFRSRLSAIRRQLLVENGFADDAAKATIAKIDRAMEFWQQRITAKSIALTWVLPLIGPVTELWKWFVPSAFVPSWAPFAVFMSVSYLLTILASSFLVKRGLALGETGRAACYPGFASGPGFYVQEKKILNAFGFEMREFPVDIAVIVGSVLLTALTYSKQMEFYKGLGMSDAQLQQMLDMQQTTDLSIMGATFAILAIVSWMRRKKLGRA
jgi:hypothetical protein